MAEKKLILTFIPSLVATLLDREKSKGAALTEAEVVAIRDNAPVVALPEDEAVKVADERGYEDIDAENCWADWQHVRLQFLDAQ